MKKLVITISGFAVVLIIVLSVVYLSSLMKDPSPVAVSPATSPAQAPAATARPAPVNAVAQTPEPAASTRTDPTSSPQTPIAGQPAVSNVVQAPPQVQPARPRPSNPKNMTSAELIGAIVSSSAVDKLVGSQDADGGLQKLKQGYPGTAEFLGRPDAGDALVGQYLGAVTTLESAVVTEAERAGGSGGATVNPGPGLLVMEVLFGGDEILSQVSSGEKGMVLRLFALASQFRDQSNPKSGKQASVSRISPNGAATLAKYLAAVGDVDYLQWVQSYPKAGELKSRAPNSEEQAKLVEFVQKYSQI